MNKRIKELAEQATTYVDPSANDGVCWDFDKEKFAELIIRECAGFAEQKYGNWYRINSPDDAPGITIKKHFGVDA
jgi:hypothetical protein